VVLDVPGVRNLTECHESNTKTTISARATVASRTGMAHTHKTDRRLRVCQIQIDSSTSEDPGIFRGLGVQNTMAIGGSGGALWRDLSSSIA